MLTRLLQEGQVQYERSAVIDDAGMLDLYDIWLRVIAETFVQQSRFDPLHTAETEQALRDSMLDWLAIAAASGSVPMEIEYRGIAHRAEIESLEFVDGRSAGLPESSSAICARFTGPAKRRPCSCRTGPRACRAWRTRSRRGSVVRYSCSNPARPRVAC